MPFAITLRFDAQTESVIEDMWQSLAAAAIVHGQQLDYGAHITLAIYPDDSPVDVLKKALESAAKPWRALPITLAGFGIFPGPSAILWAAPVVTPSLLDWHAAIQGALPALTPHPYYRSSAWMPHVTLSTGLQNPGEALAVLLPLWRPVAGHLIQVDLVGFGPIQVLHSLSLPG